MKKQTKLGIVLAAAAVISVSVASLVSAKGWVQNGSDWYYVDNNNEYVTETIQSSGNTKFYLGEDGTMQRNFFLEDYNDNTYYFGPNGAMATNTWVAIDPDSVDNQDDYVPDNYWYYFQASGKALKGSSAKVKKTTIDGKKYAFNEYGQMCVGWFGEEGKTINPDDDSNPFENALYYAGGDNDGVLRSGWVTYYDGYDGGDDEPASEYTNLYFYFNTSNNKKYGGEGEAVYKKINGRSYAFDSKGIMYSGWDVYNNRTDWSSLADKVTYFSDEDDGHQVKKGWVYAVPAQSIDGDKYDDDEEVYMYFANSGDSVKDQFKKIGGKYYAFANNGVMKTGLVLWAPAGTTGANGGIKYVDKIDLDWADGSDVVKKGILQTGATKYIQVNPEGLVIAKTDTTAGATYAANGLNVGTDAIKIHYFGDDGARKTGTNTVEFNDDTYTISTTGLNGDKGSGAFSKKYYSLGFQLKASADIRYGIYTIATWDEANNNKGPMHKQSSDGKSLAAFHQNIMDGDYIVLTTAGSKQKSNKSAKKDADGNYWLIGDSGLRGIWTVNVNGSKNPGRFVTRTANYAYNLIAATNSCTYQDLCDAGLAIEGAQDTTTMTNAVTWTKYSANNGTAVYFTMNSSGYTGPCFQSDYNDGTNKWIPAGILDNSNKTVTLNLVGCTDPKAHAYDVVPTNDYFLNCYWYAANTSVPNADFYR